jgi:hypothetical protein
MPYRASDRLENMIQPEACEAAAGDMAERLGDRYESNVKMLTPVSDAPEWARDPARPPGTARDSVHRTPVRRRRHLSGGFAFHGTVRTEDPVFPYIEWNTKPHWISPRADRAPASVVETGKPRGTVQDGRAALRIPTGPGEGYFAKRVFHPGTTGKHPFSRGALLTETEAGELCASVLVDWKRNVVRSRPRVVDSRSR